MKWARVGANEIAARPRPPILFLMSSNDNDANWVNELVQFLSTQPEIGAVRFDPVSHQVSVATVGDVDLATLEAKLAATIAAVAANLAARQTTPTPPGYRLHQDGTATVIGRETDTTGEKLWLWREMKWPEIKAEPTPEDQEWRTLAWLAAGCGVLGVAGVLAKYLVPGLPWLARGFFALGLVAGAWDAVADTRENLRKGRIDIHFLMLSVAIGASFIGAWGEAVLLLFLFSASGAMEEYALDRTQREVSALLKTSPKRATLILADGGEKEVAVGELQVGQRVRVRPGEAFAADGTVVAGRSAGDESTLTGEATPVEKGPGDQVFSGTLNLWGALDFEVVRLPSESTLQKVIRLIQTAQRLKAPSERFTDKFGTGYTYAVIGGSLLMFLVWWLGFHLPPFTNTPETRSAFYRAMTLMVVASPCALVLSIPSAILAAIAWGARHGVLFRGGAAIEKLAEINVVALDKTGTLTTGELTVVGYESFPAGREQEVMELAYALEAKSEHPLARAIVRDAKARGVRAVEIADFQNIAGAGVRGRLGDTQMLLGRRELLEAGPLAQWAEKLPPAPAELAEIWVVGRDVLGRVLLRDQIRAESRAVLAELKRLGIHTVI